ncbi:MAG: GtrA family protein [Herbaspirillum sp.]|nr:GtrA family protein [Herbaspirillum sp.]
MSNFPMAERAKNSFVQLTRYALVGIVSNSAGYLVYLLLTYLGVAPKVAMTLLYGIGAAIGYVGNRSLTFTHKGSALGSGIRYFMAHFLGYCINLAILIIFVDELGYAHQWVQVSAIFVVASFLFIAFKFFVFADNKASNMDGL